MTIDTHSVTETEKPQKRNQQTQDSKPYLAIRAYFRDLEQVCAELHGSDNAEVKRAGLVLIDNAPARLRSILGLGGVKP